MSAVEQAMRLARAAVFATVCVVASAGGHSFAGGMPVAMPALLAGAAVTFALALLLARRERGPEAVLAATTAAQFALHELFTRSAPMPVAATGHEHGGTPGLGMTIAHLTVALVTGWWLYRGESTVWLMLRLWGMPPLAVAWLLLAAPVRVRVPARIVTPAEARPYRPPVLAAAVYRRGPPPPVPAR
ncbi:hypothetical protein HNP84_007141 [Thermocatellispora tengchongensis]|uniref:Uncharacterized protein n=1 Tax=Thermocatellispora tengchongensis TaxID=1073253 RepID=A0A840PEH9_9ACTN|nr:MFS transporter [Thermocatellispora tengchongensis]MBB5137389.1 hypothetical protein [Thermocatellispora tengchongensis]